MGGHGREVCVCVCVCVFRELRKGIVISAVIILFVNF